MMKTDIQIGVEMAKELIEKYLNGKAYLSAEGLDRLLEVIKEEELVR